MALYPSPSTPLFLATDKKQAYTHLPSFLHFFSAPSDTRYSLGTGCLMWKRVLFLIQILGMRFGESESPYWQLVYGTCRSSLFLLHIVLSVVGSPSWGRPSRNINSTSFLIRSFLSVCLFQWASTVSYNTCTNPSCETPPHALPESWYHTSPRIWGISWCSSCSTQSEWRFWIRGRVWDSCRRFRWVIRTWV